MADATVRKLLQLLRPDAPLEMRQAAILVLGEIGSRSPEVDQALCAALADPEQGVRVQVMTAIGKLRVEAALPRLLERAIEGGPEAEVAAQAAAHLGAKATRGLREIMSQAAPGLRRRIASALAAGGTASSETAALDALLDADPGVVDAATRSLISKVPSLGKDHRRALADHALEMLQTSKKERLPLPAEVALVRLLAALDDPRGQAIFLGRLDPKTPPELRAAALQALGALTSAPARDKLRPLLACAADPDFRVAAPALMLLKGIPVQERTWKEWLPLLDAPDPAARRFAIEKVGDRDSEEVAEALLGQLTHPDRALREEALASLARLEKGREALAQAVLEAANADEAWTLARTQAPFAREYPTALRTQLFSRTCAYLEAGDRRADPLLFLLREADAHDLRDRLEERAQSLRKKKNYAGALVYLRLLTRDPACGETIRFESAACHLKVSNHDLAADARVADPALRQFAGLVHRHETDPAEMMRKARWVDAEELFYLGFHFTEGKGPERAFGTEMLNLLIKRSPRSKLAKDARSKLRSEGAS